MLITKTIYTDVKTTHLHQLQEENIVLPLPDFLHNWHALQSRESPQPEETGDLKVIVPL